MDEVITNQSTITIEMPVEEIEPTDKPQDAISTEQPPGEKLSTSDPQINGEIKFEDIILTKATSEKATEKFVFENYTSLWKEIFNEDAIECIKQYAEVAGVTKIGNSHLFSRGSRIDLFIKCKSGNNYLVEIKNPAYGQNQTMNAIGKLLFYSTIFPEGNKMVLLSTLYERAFADVIKKYNLPIDFVLLTKDKAFLLKK